MAPGGAHLNPSYFIGWNNSADKFSKILKRILIENAVHGVEDLIQVQTQAQHMTALKEKPSSWEQYCSLLLSVATWYNHTFTTKANSKNVQRRVYSHQLHDSDTTSADSFSIDVSLYTIYTYQAATVDKPYDNGVYMIQQANVQHPNVRLPDNILWNKLTRRARLQWKKIDRINKVPILGRGLSNNSSNPFRIAHTHEQLSHLQLPYPNYGRNVNDAIERPTNAESIGEQLEINKVVVKSPKYIPPGNLHRLMSENYSTNSNTGQTADNKSHNSGNTGKTVTVNGVTYTANVHQICYSTNQSSRNARCSLVDRGANGVIAGNDVRIIDDTQHMVGVRGIDQHKIRDIPICTVEGVVQTDKGPIIAVFHQHAYSGKNKTIYLSIQMEMLGSVVDDRSKRAGGKQTVTIALAYTIPLQIKEGQPYMNLHPHTDEEFGLLPHILFTSDKQLDPSVADNEIDPNEVWYNAIDTEANPQNARHLFNKYSEYRNRTLVHSTMIDEIDMEQYFIASEHFFYEVYDIQVIPEPPDYNEFIPQFGYTADAGRIKRRFEHSICVYLALHRPQEILPFAIFSINIARRQEDVATDSFYADVPAIASGDMMGQFYCRMDLLICDVYEMKSEKQVVNTLEDVIRRCGAMDRLLSGQTKSETEGRMLDLLQTYVVGNWNNEPNYQNQNLAERRYQTVKCATNCLMERSGSPANTWLLCICYVCYILNHLAHLLLHRRTPLKAFNGITPDISALLLHTWLKPVY